MKINLVCISDNFNFKVMIFYNKYKKYLLQSNIYIYSTFIILLD